MLGAVILDFDGVITDSEVLHFRSFNKALELCGSQISKQEYYRDFLGLTDVDFFKTAAQKGLISMDDLKLQQLLGCKKETFEQLARTDGQIIEGVRDFLEMLGQSKTPTAICSGALQCEIEFILEDAGLRSFFEVIVAAEHTQRGKPHPDGLLATLAGLNRKRAESILPAQCVVIEDSHWGLKAAAAAGMHPVGITNSYEPKQLKPAERIVRHLGELDLQQLQQLCM